MINLLDSVLTGAISVKLSDEECISKYLETQNVSYFNLLYDRYSSKVYAKCIAMLKEEFRAQDAVQDIFMKVLLNLSKFKGDARFSTWLYSITYNFCIDTIRRRKKSMATHVEDINNLGDKELVAEVDDKEILEVEVGKLKIILDEIPAADKSVLLMKYLDGMSIKEMSVVLDKTESAIKMKIKRAKEKFIRTHRRRFAS